MLWGTTFAMYKKRREMLFGAENLWLQVTVVELCPCWKLGCVRRRAKEAQPTLRPRLEGRWCLSFYSTSQRL